MRFVVDESSWNFHNISPEDCIIFLDNMLDLLSHAQENQQLICYSEDLFNISVFENMTFYDLYSPDSPINIPREIQERIAVIFNNLPKWQELESTWPSDFNVQIANNNLYAPSIAWAHKQTFLNIKNAIGCFTFSSRQTGMFRVGVETENIDMWLISSEEEFIFFFRWLILQASTNHSDLEENAHLAFPNIDFVDDVFKGIRDMNKPYHDLVNDLVIHLSAFSDHGVRIFRGPRDRVPAEFGALHVEISDENGNTKKKKNARAARTVFFNSAKRVCWWHSKLEPHQNRIYISPENILSGGKLLVGIFSNHLVT